MQGKINICYAKENSKKAVECIKDVVQAATGSCRPKLVLLTQPHCIPCAKEKAIHEKAIEAGIVQVFDIKSPQGQVIAAKNEIGAVPILLLLDCEDKIIYPSD